MHSRGMEKSDKTVYGHFSVIKNANIIHKTLQTRIHPDKLLGCKSGIDLGEAPPPQRAN